MVSEFREWGLSHPSPARPSLCPTRIYQEPRPAPLLAQTCRGFRSHWVGAGVPGPAPHPASRRSQHVGLGLAPSCGCSSASVATCFPSLPSFHSHALLALRREAPESPGVACGSDVCVCVCVGDRGGKWTPCLPHLGRVLPASFGHLKVGPIPLSSSRSWGSSAPLLPSLGEKVRKGQVACQDPPKGWQKQLTRALLICARPGAGYLHTLIHLLLTTPQERDCPRLRDEETQGGQVICPRSRSLQG